MLLTGGLITASLESAVAVRKTCYFPLKAPDGTIVNEVKVDVNWEYSSSGASVRPSYVGIYNDTGRTITVNTNRWQKSDGTPPVDRGPGGQIANAQEVVWFPDTWFKKTQSPYVGVSAYATSRLGLGGSVKCRP